MGADAEIMWPRISNELTVKTHFSRLMAKKGETIGGQGIEKGFQMKEVCLPVQRTQMGVVHVCKHPFKTVSGAVHHSLKSLYSVRLPKWHEQILKQAKCYDNLCFWVVCGCNRDLVITLDKVDY